MSLLIELVPTFLFVGIYLLGDSNIFKATLGGMVASAIATLIYYVYFKKITPMQLVLLSMLLILGGLTIYFESPDFIQLLPTFIYSTFGAVVVVSMYNKKPILRVLFGEKFLKHEEKKLQKINLWNDMSYHFGGFLAFLAILNLLIVEFASLHLWVFSKLIIFILFFCFIVWELRWAYRKISPKSSFSHWLGNFFVRSGKN